MTESSVRVSARCEDCNRLYRVSDSGRAYRCKACGGAVRTDGGSARAGGLVVEGTDMRSLQQEATAALKRAHASINLIVVMYRLGALAYAVATMLAVTALARTEVPRGPGVLVVVLTTLLSALMLMAALHIRFKPFLWTVAIASLATAVTVVHLVGPNPYGLAFLGSAAWAALAWAALAPTSRFSDLIAQHKDLYVLHHASMRTRRSIKGRTPEDRHERLMRAMRKAARRTWKISSAAAAGLCLASVLGTYLVLASARPQEFSPALERFQTAWNGADLAALGELFDPRVRAPESRRLAGLLEGHGWREIPPRLTDGRSQREGDAVSVDYDLAGVTLSTRWVLVGTRWSLVHVDLPIPPLAPTLEGFLQAWRDSDQERIAGFFTAGVQAEMLERIATAVQNRGWDRLPEILDSESSDNGRGEAVVMLQLEPGKLKTEWHFRTEGEWRLHALRFPRR